MNEILLIFILIIVILIEMQLVVQQRKNSTVPSRRSTRGACFVDTSVLMDGRILAVAQTGFIPSKLAIPRSVLHELQLLADGGDSDKRSRARHGLDIAKQLQDETMLQVLIVEDAADAKDVDHRLLELAKRHAGTVCTNDFNLNKLAQVEGVRVLNLNDLARQVKLQYLPGERVSIEIMQKGSDAHQGVGYLADGTMVVVDKAHKDIGSHVQIEFIRSLQTAAGRMLFAKKVASDKTASTAQVNKKSSSQTSGRAKIPAKRKSAEASLVDLANR